MLSDKIEKNPDEASHHEWRHVPVGACVQLKAGVCHVIARDGDLITMQHARTGKQVTGSPNPGQQVRVLQPGDDLYVAPPEEVSARAVTHGIGRGQELLATTLVKIHLGATLVATRDLSGPPNSVESFTCPPLAQLRPVELATHLYLFHRLESDDPVTLATPPASSVLLALHDSRRATAPHRHA